MEPVALRRLFLNLGHTLDHLFMLIYATAVLTIGNRFGLTYGEMLKLATPGLIAFGGGAWFAGWLGDRWSRTGMITIFYVGIGLASIATSFAQNGWQIATGLFFIGLFASIYHPVGIAMVVEGAGDRTGWILGVNGVWGNMGVAIAAPLTAYLAVHLGWQSAFVVPGLVSIAIGVAYRLMVPHVVAGPKAAKKKVGLVPGWQRVLLVLALTTTFGGVIFQASTNTMPKIFAERLTGITSDLETLATMMALIYAAAAFIQLVVGRAIDKYDMRLIFSGLALANVAVLFVAITATDWTMLATALVLMFMIFGQIPITDTLVTRYTPDLYRGRVFAAKYLLNLGVASVAMVTIGWLHDRTGNFTLVFQAMTACSFMVFLATLGLPGRRAQQPVAQPAE